MDIKTHSSGRVKLEPTSTQLTLLKVTKHILTTAKHCH
jgi:hypothetical protein